MVSKGTKPKSTKLEKEQKKEVIEHRANIHCYRCGKEADELNHKNVCPTCVENARRNSVFSSSIER